MIRIVVDFPAPFGPVDFPFLDREIDMVKGGKFPEFFR
jgi:hypothetical protein